MREMREVDETLAERATSAMCQEPNEKIVARGQSSRVRWWVMRSLLR